MHESNHSSLITSSGEADLRVLVVDDHDDILSMMNLLLKQRRYAVATANSGHQALQVAESFAPHIVVSDIGMPEMDGYEMMIVLRSMQQLTPFKSIALTGYDINPDQDLAHAAGYDLHLTKPVDFEALFRMIDDLAISVRQVQHPRHACQ